MTKKKSLIMYFIILQFLFCGLLLSTLSPTIASSSTYDYYDLKSSAVDFSNATVVSDGFNSSYWNDGASRLPRIAVDNSNVVHAVWCDDTDGVWGTDWEIMYATYTDSTGWSNVTVISDGYIGSYWNDRSSLWPAIAIDSNNAVHAVWQDETDGVWGTDTEIMYAQYTDFTGWSNITVISDGYGGSYWNDGHSGNTAIVIDSSNAVHVVWEDKTDGVWGIDIEIMYAQYTDSTGWSNVTVISDGYGGSYWNTGSSLYPTIAIDGSNAVHVVWEDLTNGVWGTDSEIMYAQYTDSTGWSNVTVISDGYGGNYWNDGFSTVPKIAVDSSNAVHIVWHDFTDGEWGIDVEIMYAQYTNSTGWSNVTVISDGYSGNYWNDGNSCYPAIAIDSSNTVHAVWCDDTVGVWGTDVEIMYAKFTDSMGWSNITVISDGYGGSYWNDGGSLWPAIAIDSSNAVHIVWDDYTAGIWGIDEEIMHAILVLSIISPDGIPFGNFYLLFIAVSIIGLIVYKKRKL